MNRAIERIVRRRSVGSHPAKTVGRLAVAFWLMASALVLVGPIDNARAQLGRVGGAVVVYEFGEGAGSVVADSSGVGVGLDLTIGDPSAVVWEPGGGLTVTAPTLITSTVAATKVIDAVAASGELTLEAWVAPAGVDQSGPARIVSISASGSARNVTLGQNGAAYDVRLRTSTTTRNGLPSTSTDPGTLTTALTHVVFTRDQTGQTRIYLDGIEVDTDNRPGTLNWATSYPLVLAAEASNRRPWLGTYCLVAVYDQALTPTQITQNHTTGCPTG